MIVFLRLKKQPEMHCVTDILHFKSREKNYCPIKKYIYIINIFSHSVGGSLLLHKDKIQ